MSEMALAGEIPSSRRLDEEEDVSVGETDQLYGHLYQWPRRNKEDVDAIAFVLFFFFYQENVFCTFPSSFYKSRS